MFRTMSHLSGLSLSLLVSDYISSPYKSLNTTNVLFRFFFVFFFCVFSKYFLADILGRCMRCRAEIRGKIRKKLN